MENIFVDYWNAIDCDRLVRFYAKMVKQVCDWGNYPH